MPIGKFAVGLKGFPTPDSPSGVPAYLMFLFADETWAQYILGALEPMVSEYNWYEAGALLPEQASEAFRIIIQQAPYNLVPANVDTPYWDEASDVQDQAPADSQTWYGQVTDVHAAPASLTWFENAAIWTFTGLLAVSGTPAAAILFNTVAPKFVLAQKAGNVAEVIRIVVDAQDIAMVDTTGRSGQIIETTVVPDPAVSPHQIMLIKVS